MKGKRILISRPEEQAKELKELVEKEGGIPIVLPLIRFEASQDNSELFKQFERLEEIDWIVFTSSTAVNFFFHLADEKGIKFYYYPDLKIATVGEKTKLKLEQLGYRTNFVPIKFTAQVLAENMDEVNGKTILIPRSNLASNEYVLEFEKRGATALPITVYNNLAIDYAQAELNPIFNEPIDYLTFASGSSFRAFHALIQKQSIDISSAKIVCIGPSTAKVARDLGYEVAGIAETHTVEGMIETIKELN